MDTKPLPGKECLLEGTCTLVSQIHAVFYCANVTKTNSGSWQPLHHGDREILFVWGLYFLIYLKILSLSTG